MNLGLGEIIVILVIAFVVVGPEDLPRIARALGKGVRQARGLYAKGKKSLSLDDELTEISKEIRAVHSDPFK